MELNNFIIRLILIMLPGIITLYVYRMLKGKNANKKDWEDILEILLFSLINYSIFYLIIAANNLLYGLHDKVAFISELFDEKATIYWPEILWTSLIGILSAFILSAADTFKIINKLGRFLKVTKRYGDEDVWEFVLNPRSREWFYVRDHKLNLIYYGFIQLYSDSGKERELLINDVDVYDNLNGGFLYSTKSLYICRDKYDLSIEIPEVITNQDSNEQGTKK